MNVRIPVLYEDSAAAGQIRNFGPHRLALNCLYDRTGKPYGLEKHFDPIPKRGVNKLLADLERDMGSHIVAVVDGDHLRDALGVPASMPIAATKIAMSKLYKSGTIDVCVLEKNLETVVEVLRTCLHDPPEQRQLFEAALKKDLNARDIVLARAPASARQCLQKNMTSFEAFVDTLYKLVPPDLLPAHP